MKDGYIVEFMQYPNAWMEVAAMILILPKDYIVYFMFQKHIKLIENPFKK